MAVIIGSPAAERVWAYPGDLISSVTNERRFRVQLGPQGDSNGFPQIAVLRWNLEAPAWTSLHH